MFNERVASIFRCCTHVVIDESTSAWHGKDEKLPNALFNGRALGLGGISGEGQCRLCLNKHASGDGRVQDVLPRSQYRPSEAFLEVLSWETWPAVLLPASDSELDDLSRAKEVIAQLHEFRETDWC